MIAILPQAGTLLAFMSLQAPELNVHRLGGLNYLENPFAYRRSNFSVRNGSGDIENERTKQNSNNDIPNLREKDNLSKNMKQFRKKKNKDGSTTLLQTWRCFGIEVHPDALGKNSIHSKAASKKISADKMYLLQPVLDSLCDRLRIKLEDGLKVDMISSLENQVENDLTQETKVVVPDQLIDVRVVRRSLDARRKRRNLRSKTSKEMYIGPAYTFVLDVDVTVQTAKKMRLKHQPGRMELLASTGKTKKPSKDESKTKIRDVDADADADANDNADANANANADADNSDEITNDLYPQKPRIIIVGAGPAGLFCALTLANSGVCTPILVERGQPVESRATDISALMNHQSMKSESNYAFGEGGAGTWSDGKLTTRIGRNSDVVRHVLKTLVKYGAPKKILVDGAPHLGTDNLVKLLRKMRLDLREMGGIIRFGAKMTKLNIDEEKGIVTGIDVDYSDATERKINGFQYNNSDVEGKSETIVGDAVVIATGHSARDVYEELHNSGIKLEPKGFAVGYRIEHPQKNLNKIQYGNEWGRYAFAGKIKTDAANNDYFPVRDIDPTHEGRLPVSSYSLATDKAFDGVKHRSVYSFCMCPGGQVVPASTEPNEVCVNGMSFSKRDSLWGNSALVVNVDVDDPVLDELRTEHGVLAGIAFQRGLERRAAEMGGGNFTVPVQRLTDFIKYRPSTSAPSSSYRLGVKPSACHELLPYAMVEALRDAVLNHFEKKMKGFICDDALLHGVETRTSSPVRICRDPDTMQAIGVKKLFPSGEGAGFAGGIVSAACDGVHVGDAILEDLNITNKTEHITEWSKARKKTVGFDY